MDDKWFFAEWADEDGGIEIAPGYKDSRGVYWRAIVADGFPAMLRQDSAPANTFAMPIRNARQPASLELRAIESLKYEFLERMMYVERALASLNGGMYPSVSAGSLAPHSHMVYCGGDPAYDRQQQKAMQMEIARQELLLKAQLGR